MKQFIILTILLNFFSSSFGQQPEQNTTTAPSPKQKYLTRSNDQLVGGIILASAGAGLIVLGASVQRKATGFDFSGLFLEAVGVIAIGGSVPLFISSAHNRQKAKHLAINIKTEQAIALRQFVCSHQFFPAIALKINL